MIIQVFKCVTLFTPIGLHVHAYYMEPEYVAFVLEEQYHDKFKWKGSDIASITNKQTTFVYADPCAYHCIHKILWDKY